MLKKMGISLNFDESKLLIASADAHGTNNVSVDEFIDIIFQENDPLTHEITTHSKSYLENETPSHIINEVKHEAEEARIAKYDQ
jgi:hypothetical protein